ncbi:hypothetical protein AB205_0050600 [Aquarana catesbeiana]|uniref:Uncharacterized protein n=1 Tax=Aquarana catesbeiana TaxID=8400 RepID=A0A2G9QLB2_AQUCT|nr:hypothetical protein AB205_0050600 [Aquarana catesbeiana]
MFHIPISAIKYLCAKYTFFFFTCEKRLGKSEETRDSPPPEEGEIPQTQAEEEEGDIVEIGKIVTLTGDGDVVEEECHFTSESAQILIGEIMGCNHHLEHLKRKTSMMFKKK